jgi:excisionase family DNA binding protein
MIRERAQTIEVGELRTTTEVLTFEEARARLRVGRSTMFRLMQEGDLPSFKIGRSLRFTGDDLERFLHDRRRAS